MPFFTASFPFARYRLAAAAFAIPFSIPEISAYAPGPASLVRLLLPLAPGARPVAVSVARATHFLSLLSIFVTAPFWQLAAIK